MNEDCARFSYYRTFTTPTDDPQIVKCVFCRAKIENHGPNLAKHFHRTCADSVNAPPQLRMSGADRAIFEANNSFTERLRSGRQRTLITTQAVGKDLGGRQTPDRKHHSRPRQDTPALPRQTQSRQRTCPPPRAAAVANTTQTEPDEEVLPVVPPQPGQAEQHLTKSPTDIVSPAVCPQPPRTAKFPVPLEVEVEAKEKVKRHPQRQTKEQQAKRQLDKNRAAQQRRPNQQNPQVLDKISVDSDQADQLPTRFNKILVTAAGIELSDIKQQEEKLPMSVTYNTGTKMVVYNITATNVYLTIPAPKTPPGSGASMKSSAQSRKLKKSPH